MMSQVLPHGQVSFDLLLRCDLADVLLGFMPVVVLNANLHEGLRAGKQQGIMGNAVHC